MAMAVSHDTEIEVGADVVTEKPKRPRPLYVFAITYTDGFYAVLHAYDADHAIELSKERYPNRVVQHVELKFPY